MCWFCFYILNKQNLSFYEDRWAFIEQYKTYLREMQVKSLDCRKLFSSYKTDDARENFITAYAHKTAQNQLIHYPTSKSSARSVREIIRNA